MKTFILSFRPVDIRCVANGADNIVNSERKECPQCKRGITTDSFNLMKFKVDLEIDTSNQTLFL